jgi:hypothetical protein
MVREELPTVRNWLLSLQEDAEDCAGDEGGDETRNPPILIHHSAIADTLAWPACLFGVVRGGPMQGYASWTVALGLALTCVACSGGSSSSGLTPMVITPPASTETFTGTVPVGGNAVHPFTLTAGGEIRVTLTAAGPPPTIQMGLGIGSPSVTAACSLFANGAVGTAAGTTAQLVGTAPAGPYCVAVFDVGNQTDAISYSISVVHP